MKDNFPKCLAMLLKHEGGYVNHPRDPGGRTNLGVTQRVYEAWLGREVTEQEMRALTARDVAPIYRKKFWDVVWGDHLPSGVDWAVFDWAVNSGPTRAVRALQRIVGSTPDGAMGPKTLARVRATDAREIIVKLHGARQVFFESLPTFDVFGRGWTRRNVETRDAALDMSASGKQQ